MDGKDKREIKCEKCGRYKRLKQRSKDVGTDASEAKVPKVVRSGTPESALKVAKKLKFHFPGEKLLTEVTSQAMCQLPITSGTSTSISQPSTSRACRPSITNNTPSQNPPSTSTNPTSHTPPLTATNPPSHTPPSTSSNPPSHIRPSKVTNTSTHILPSTSPANPPSHIARSNPPSNIPPSHNPPSHLRSASPPSTKNPEYANYIRKADSNVPPHPSPEGKVYCGTLPAHYKPLEQVVCYHPSSNKITNIVAVVSDVTCPVHSQGRDDFMKIYLIDPTVFKRSIEVMWFAKIPYFPETYRSGDIIFIENIKVQQYRGVAQLKSLSQTKTAVIPFEDVEDGQLLRTARQARVTVPPYLRRALAVLKTWLFRNKQMICTSTFHSICSVVEEGTYYNIVVKVVRIVHCCGSIILTVWDGTLPVITPTQVECPHKPTDTVVWDVTTLGQDSATTMEVLVKDMFVSVTNANQIKPGGIVIIYAAKLQKNTLVLEETDDIRPHGIRVMRVAS